MPPHAVLRKGEMAYVQFDLLADLGQKWERTNIRIASGIFLEREREKKITQRAVQFKERFPDV